MKLIPAGANYSIPAKLGIRILLFPGTGDIHWVMLKLRNMLLAPQHKPTVYIWNVDKRPRSIDFVNRIPFVDCGGYWGEFDKRLLESEAFQGLGDTGAHNIVQDWLGFDYVISFNGSLTRGTPLAQIVPNAVPDWNYPLKLTEAEVKARDLYAKEYGQYVMLYFSDHGMFANWINRLPVARIVEFLRAAQSKLPNHRLILTGSSWDVPFSQQVQIPGVINLTGQTNLDQFFGLLRGARAFCGFPGGNTIISTHLGVPTVMIWDKFFANKGFRTNWVDPAKLNKLYFPEETDGFAVGRVVATLQRLVLST